MVQVNFTGSYLSLSGDPLNEIYLGASEVSKSVTARGEVKQYRGGVRRSVTLEGTTDTFQSRRSKCSRFIQIK